jgi:hypothetical protein
LSAPALVDEIITLRVSGQNQRLSAEVFLSVTERQDIVLEAPSEVLLTSEGVDVRIENQGNVTDTITLDWVFDDAIVATRTFALESQAVNVQTFEISKQGVYTVVLNSEKGLSLRKGVTVISFGVPEPDPFLLSAKWRASYDLNGSWYTSLELDGRLSDYVDILGKIDSRYLQNTFVWLRGNDWGLRLGETGGDPYGFGMNAGLGFAGYNDQSPWSVAYGLGWLVEDKFSGYFATSYQSDVLTSSVGIGMSSGRIYYRAGLNVKQFFPEVEGELSGSMFFRDNVLTLALSGSGVGLDEDFPGKLQGELRAKDLFTERADFRVKLNYTFEGLTLNTSGIFPIGQEGESDWEVNLNNTISEPETTEFALQLSASQYSLWARRFDTFESDGFISYGFGVTYRPPNVGAGVSLAIKRTPVGQNFGFDGRVEFYPQILDFDGKLEARYQFKLNQFTTALAGYWSLSDDALGANINGGTIRDRMFRFRQV